MTKPTRPVPRRGRLAGRGITSPDKEKAALKGPSAYFIRLIYAFIESLMFPAHE